MNVGQSYRETLGNWCLHISLTVVMHNSPGLLTTLIACFLYKEVFAAYMLTLGQNCYIYRLLCTEAPYSHCIGKLVL